MLLPKSRTSFLLVISRVDDLAALRRLYNVHSLRETGFHLDVYKRQDPDLLTALDFVVSGAVFLERIGKAAFRFVDLGSVLVPHPVDVYKRQSWRRHSRQGIGAQWLS